MAGACSRASRPGWSIRSPSWPTAESSTSFSNSSPPTAASSTSRWPLSPSACARSSPDRPDHTVPGDRAPGMAVHRSGSGPDVVLFHGGMGSWKHWTRNIEPLATRFTVHALDHPSYGASAPVPREICRHNLLINMLSDPASISEETLDIQADCVRRTRFNSRKVSGGGTLLGDLAQLTCRIRLLWGERDDSRFRPADLLIGEIREAVGTLDLHRIPRAGHWSAYENAPEVNRLMLEFFSAA